MMLKLQQLNICTYYLHILFSGIGCWCVGEVQGPECAHWQQAVYMKGMIRLRLSSEMMEITQFANAIRFDVVCCIVAGDISRRLALWLATNWTLLKVWWIIQTTLCTAYWTGSHTSSKWFNKSFILVLYIILLFNIWSHYRYLLDTSPWSLSGYDQLGRDLRV